jgi:hypothetical protein
MSYDVWGNVTSKTGRTWSRAASFTGTFVNGRKSGWSYDAAGNVLADDSFTHTFDAAGRQTHAVSISQAGDGSGQYPMGPAQQFDETFDGDGHAGVREQHTRQGNYLYDENGNPSYYEDQTDETCYYLRSSVLGGAAVADLTTDGAGGLMKKRGYFYAGGARIANRDQYGTLQYEHAVPGANSWVATREGDRYADRKERDPAGGELPLYDPNPGQGYVSTKGEQPLYIEGGDPFDYSGGNTIDGLPVSQAEFERRMGGGGGAVGIEVTIGGHSLGVFGIPYRGLGYMPNSITIGSWVNGFNEERGSSQVVEGDVGEGEQTSEVDYRFNVSTRFVSATYRLAGFGGGLGFGSGRRNQQTNNANRKLTDEELLGVRGFLVLGLESHKGCKEFMTEYLTELGNITGRRPFSTNPIEIFDRIVSLGVAENTNGPAGETSGSAGSGNVIFRLNMKYLKNSPIALAEILHEITHGAPNSGRLGGEYSHPEMNRAAFNIMNRGIANFLNKMGLTDLGQSVFDEEANYGGTLMNFLCGGR